MITTAQKKLISKAFNSFRSLDNITHTPYREELFRLEKDYEKRHRKTFFDRSYGLSVSDAAKYFTVCHLLEAYDKPDRYDVSDYLDVKKSIFAAQSIALNYPDILELAFLEFDRSEFEALDYCKLMEV
jgi:hypothetical protein